MNTPEPASTLGRPRGRILVVDDNPEGCSALARVLELKGYAVTVAGDGSSALEALRTGPPPDFVLTDLLLPDLDGLEVARQARRLSPPPRIALITGWQLEADPLDEPESGIDQVFLKPLDVRDLLVNFLERAPGP